MTKAITKDFIANLKNNPSEFLTFIETQNDSNIMYVLERLGKLENGNSKEPLLHLLNYPNEKIRTLSIKNLAKLKDPNLLSTFIKYANTGESSSVRREAVSAIGRLRNEKTIPTNKKRG